MRSIPLILAAACGFYLSGNLGAAESEPPGRPMDRPGRPPASLESRSDLPQKLEALRGQLRQLQEANQPDEARRVRAQIEELERQQAVHSPGPGREAERADMEERARVMEMEIRELRRQGQEQEAARLERERRQMVERLGITRGRLAGPEPRPGAVGAWEREAAEPLTDQRRQHLRAAIENLRAAGFPDLAEMVERESRARAEGGVRGGDPERLDRMEMELRELRQMVRDLQRRTGPPRPLPPREAPLER